MVYKSGCVPYNPAGSIRHINDIYIKCPMTISNNHKLSFVFKINKYKQVCVESIEWCLQVWLQ